MNHVVSIAGASEGVCLLCGGEGPVFEITTACGRLSGVPVCGKDLFALVIAQTRNGAVRSAAKSRTKSAGTKSRSTESGPSQETDGAAGSRSVSQGDAFGKTDTWPDSASA